MNFVKQLLASFLLTVFYSFALASGFAVVQITPNTLEVSPGDQIVFEARVPELGREEISYQWFIDGVPLEDVQTSSLDLTRTEYAAYFPQDNENDSNRSVSVVITDIGGEVGADEATLQVQTAMSHDHIPLTMMWPCETDTTYCEPTQHTV